MRSHTWRWLGALSLLAAVGCSSSDESPSEPQPPREYGPTFGAEWAAWSPDGDVIAFYRQYGGEGLPDGLWLVDADGENVRFLAPGTLPEWSPDGKKIAFSASRRIHVLTLETMDVLDIPSGPRSDFCAWSPSGDSLVYEVAWENTEPQIGGLYIASKEGTGARRVTTLFASEPTWAGSHEWIAFTVSAGNYKRMVQAVSPDGSSMRDLSGLEDFVYSPEWSSSGRFLAYCTPNGIKVLDMESGATKLLDSFGDLPHGGRQACSWSPDENWLVYNRGDLWVMSRDGSSNHPIGEVSGGRAQARPPTQRSP